MPKPSLPVWSACPECGASFLDRELPPRAELRCGRCGLILRKHADARSLQRMWAIASAGLLTALLANLEPILTFSICGNAQSNHIVTGVQELTKQGYWPVAILVAFSGIFAPFLHLGAVWYVLGACCLRRPWPAIKRVARAVEMLAPWNLAPVYAVGTVVAVVRLEMLGNVYWKLGAFWILMLSLCSMVVMQLFNPQLIEERLEEIAA